MAKKGWVVLLGIVFLAAAPFHLFAAEKTMSVQVKSGHVRSIPGFLGKITAQLSYGDQVTVLEAKSGWMRISSKGGSIRGWMHESALTKKKIKLAAGGKSLKSSATTDEIALAGKGFNKQVEGEFKSRNPDISFKWIDAMEKMTVTDKEIRKFLLEGDLAAKGGSR